MSLLLEVLRTVEFLVDGPAELAQEFMDLGHTRTVACGQLLWKSGQAPQGIVVPVSGELAAIKSDSDGRELCYAFFEAGDCAGAPCVLDDAPHLNDLRAIRGGEFFVMGCREFRRFVDERPAVRARVLASIGGLFRRSLEERDRIVFLPVGARLARFLLERACVRQARGARLLLRETHAELAVRLGTVREVVARAMAEFAERGLIRRTRHALFVVNWTGLRAEGSWDPGEKPDGSREAAAAALRTRRFVLRALQAGPDDVAAELACCHEHLAGLALCNLRGCPLALADGTKRGTPIVRASPVRRPAAGPAGRSAHDRPARRAGPHTSPGDAPERSPRDQRVVERRIELYRARVTTIESKFGEEAPVPGRTSVFRRPFFAET